MFKTTFLGTTKFGGTTSECSPVAAGVLIPRKLAANLEFVIGTYK